MNTSIVKRSEGGQPGNRNALKHGLYTRFYTEELKKKLVKLDIKNFIGEVFLLRVGIDHIAELLLMEESQVMEAVALLNALTRSAQALTSMVKCHFLLNTSDDPVYIAWDDITHERDFFTDGEPPE